MFSLYNLFHDILNYLLAMINPVLRLL